MGTGGSERRPAVVSQEIQEQIVLRIATGDSLEEVCRAEDMPSQDTVLTLVVTNFEFRKKYEMAQAIQAEMLLDGILEIADDGRDDWIASDDPERPGFRLNADSIRRARMRIDASKWLIRMLRPSKYGRAAKSEKVEMMPVARFREFLGRVKESEKSTPPHPPHCRPPEVLD